MKCQNGEMIKKTSMLNLPGVAWRSRTSRNAFHRRFARNSTVESTPDYLWRQFSWGLLYAQVLVVSTEFQTAFSLLDTLMNHCHHPYAVSGLALSETSFDVLIANVIGSWQMAGPALLHHEWSFLPNLGGTKSVVQTCTDVILADDRNKLSLYARQRHNGCAYGFWS